MGDLVRGPWTSHPFRGRHVVMFGTRRGWGRLHLTEGGGDQPGACGAPIQNAKLRKRSAWRSWTNNPRGWNSGAYKGEFPPCRRCLKLLEVD